MRISRCSIVLLLATAMLTSCHDPNSPDTPSDQKDSAQLKEENITYTVDTTSMNGYVVYSDSIKGPRPAVLVVHEWWGLNDYSKNRAKQLAEMGYIAMAVDMFGKGQTAANPDEAMKLSGPFYSDAQLAKKRLDAAIAKLKTYTQTDTSKMAAIGYCFGGAIVLNAAKLGSDLDGVVSFHGSLAGAAPDKNKLKAQMLVCHGGADGFVPTQDSLTFRKQLDSVGAAYTFITYPNAKHAFTNPAATENGKKFNLDIAYNEEADKKSWNDMKDFFSRIFK